MIASTRTKATSLSEYLADCDRKKIRKPVHRKNSHPHITEWAKRISIYNHGLDRKAYRLKAETVVTRARAKRYSPISKSDMVRHEAGEITLFYMSESAWRNPYIFPSIDIDCHREGQRHQDAVAFAEHLKTLPLFAGLYYETSTGGVGVHAPFKFNKLNIDSRHVRQQLAKLETYLQALAVNFNVDVEVMGLPPILEYDDDNLLVDINHGALCRMPRNLKDALDTATIDFHQLDRLPSVKATATRQTATATASYRSTSIIKPEHVAALPAIRADLRLAFQQAPLGKCVGSRHQATDEDLAIFLMLMYAMPKEKDGAQPYAKMAGLWTELYKCGVLQRGFSPNRYTACKNWVSRHGHINVVDPRYFYFPAHVVDKNGERKKGRAAKWDISLEMREYVQDIVSLGTHTPSFNTRNRPGINWILSGPHDHRRLIYFNFSVAETYLPDEENEKLYAA